MRAGPDITGEMMVQDDKDRAADRDAVWLARPGASRIIQDLGEGRLDTEALAALEDWLAADGWAMPPEFVVARARRIGRARRPQRGAPPLRRLVASLVYDTRTQALPVGVRTATQRARSLLFATGELEVMLQVTSDASPQRLKVMGQVLLEGTPVEAAGVQLDGPLGRIEAETDLDGEFRIADLPSGDYSLEITTTDQVIQCAPLSLEEWR